MLMKKLTLLFDGFNIPVLEIIYNEETNEVKEITLHDIQGGYICIRFLKNGKAQVEVFLIGIVLVFNHVTDVVKTLNVFEKIVENMIPICEIEEKCDELEEVVIQ